MLLIDPRNGKKMPLDFDLSDRWAKEYAAWSREGCEHKIQEVRRGTNKGGGPVIRKQCLSCGQLIGNALPRQPDAHELNAIDEEMNENYESQRTAAKEIIDSKFAKIQLERWKGNEKGQSYYQQAHAAYLKSREWKERRELVMQRSNGTCEGCRLKSASEVHHLTYINWGNEFLFELVALCENCHDRIHAKGDHEALVEGCKLCLHYSKENYCLLFDMPIAIALEIEGPCTDARSGFQTAF
jgi:5-methylcytosine-specific restriction endonuclease McrA